MRPASDEFKCLADSMAMNSAQKVSVVLPVRNGERHLFSAVKSIVAQTFEAWELIVIDDGSTDGTRDILSELARGDHRIRVLTMASGGLVSALNAGIVASRGELVARMDADDVALPHRLEQQVAEFSRRPSLVALGGQIVCIDRQNQML